MSPRDGKRSDWLCKSCEGADGKPAKNFAFRTACLWCKRLKSACFLQHADGAAVKGAGRTFAERQVQKAAAADKSELAALQKKVASLEAAAKKKAPLAAADDDEAANECEDAASQIEQLQSAVQQMEAHKKLPGVAATLVGLQAELAAARQRRDAAKPPVTRLLAAQRTLARRTTALEKAAAEKTAAQNALDVAVQTEQAATDALAVAQRVVDDWYASQAFATVSGANGHDDTEWDALAAVLTQIEALPAAIRAGNGEAAWSSMQTNGLDQVRSMVSGKLGKRVPSVAPSVAERVAAVQAKAPPAAKPSGLDGLKGIFASGPKSASIVPDGAGAASTSKTSWAEKMQAAKAAQDAEDAKEATRR